MPKPHRHETRNVRRYAAVFSLAVLGALAAGPKCGKGPPSQLDVGRVPAMSGVTSQGSASYEIPITVPPGTQSMVPSLALSYDSASGTRWMGEGWSLTGLNEIARCNTTIPVDGFVSGPDHGADDVYCLNGGRLVEVGPSGSVQEFRPELNPEIRVRATWGVVPAMNGPVYFDVELPDGTNIRLGDTADTRLVQANGPFDIAHRWVERERSDASGNYFVVTWASDGETVIYPTAIHYTANKRTGLGAYNSVHFDWVNRPDDPDVHWLGSSGTRSVRLEGIRTLAHDDPDPVATYQLRYETSGLSRVSRVVGVTVCEATGVCLPETTFEYSDRAFAAFEPVHSPGTVRSAVIGPANTYGRWVDWNQFFNGVSSIVTSFFPPNNIASGAYGVYLAVSSFKSYHKPVDMGTRAPVDLNGDGFIDTVFVLRGDWNGPAFDEDPRTTVGPIIWHVALSADASRQVTTRIVGSPIYAPLLHPDDDDIQFRYQTSLGDFDGNGRTDIMTLQIYDHADGQSGDSSHGEIRYHVKFDDNQQRGNTIPTNCARHAWCGVSWLDYSGDGNDNKIIMPGQYDGDGRMDLMVLGDDYFADGNNANLNARIYTSNGTDMVHRSITFDLGWFQYPQAELCRKPVDWNCDPTPTRNVFFSGDFDGDGLTDLAIREQYQGFFQQGAPLYHPAGPDRVALFATEMRPDGAGHRPEVEFVGRFTIASVDGAYQRLLTMDVNRDGLDDIVELYPEYPDKEKAVIWQSTGSGLARANAVAQDLGGWGELAAREGHFGYTVGNFTGKGPGIVKMWWCRQAGKDWCAEVWNAHGDGAGFYRSSNDPLVYPLANATADDLDTFMALDMDGDGLDDIVALRNAPALAERRRTTNFDLRADVMFNDGSEIPDLLLAATDGFGNRVEWGYEYGATEGVHRLIAPSANDPFHVGALAAGTVATTDHDTRPRRALVAERMLFGADDLGTPLRRWEHSYRNAKADRLLGALGFATVLTREPATNRLDARRLEQRHPFVGRAETEWSVLLGTGALVAMSETYWAERPSEGVTLPYVDARIDRIYDPEDAAGGPLVTTDTVFLVDDFGFVTSADVEVTGPSGQQAETRVEENVLAHDIGRWVLGRATEVRIDRDNGTGAIQRITERDFDIDGRVVEVREDPGTPEESTLRIVRDSLGNPLRMETVPRGGGTPRVQQLQWDLYGIAPTLLTNALGHTQQIYSDLRFGAPRRLIDADGRMTQIFYDGFGRVDRSVRPDGNVVSSIRRWANAGSPAGAVFSEQIVTPGRPGALTFFDHFERPILRAQTQYDGSSSHQRYHYDERGNLVERTRPYIPGGTVYATRMEYDVLDRLRALETDRVGGAADRWEIDFPGLLRVSRDPEGNERTFAWSASGDLAYSEDPLGNRNEFVHDSLGNLVEARDAAGIVTRWSFDRHGRILTFDSPDADADEQYQYDVFGQVSRVIDALGQSTFFSYDDLGRVLGRESPEGLVRYVYDGPNATGKLAELCGPVAAQTGPGGEPVYPPCGETDLQQEYSYDLLGRLLEERHRIDGSDYHYRYAYDAFSRTSQIEMPEDPSDPFWGTPFTLAFVYSANHYLQTVAELNPRTSQMRPLYQLDATDPANGPTSWTLGNGHIRELDLDPATGRVDRILTSTQPGFGDLQHLLLQYDGLDRLVRRTDAARGALLSDPGSGGPVPTAPYDVFAYDDASRLVSAETRPANASSSTFASYAYDGAGRIDQKDGWIYAYGGARHQVTARSSGARTEFFSYDAKGQMTSGASKSFTWNSFGRPAQVVGTGGLQGRRSDFRYGPDRRLLERTDTGFRAGGGVGTVSVESVLKIGAYAELRDDGSDRSMVYRIPGPIAVEVARPTGGPAARTHYFYTDEMGSPSVVADDAGVPVELRNHDAWGERRGSDWASLASTPEPSDVSDLGYTGHDSIDGFGFVQAGIRLYDPGLGRFLSRDPVSIPAKAPGLDPYAYVWNEPTRRTDPTGAVPSGFASCPPDCPTPTTTWYGVTRPKPAPVAATSGSAAGSVGRVAKLASLPASFVKDAASANQHTKGFSARNIAAGRNMNAGTDVVQLDDSEPAPTAVIVYGVSEPSGLPPSGPPNNHPEPGDWEGIWDALVALDGGITLMKVVVGLGEGAIDGAAVWAGDIALGSIIEGPSIPLLGHSLELIGVEAGLANPIGMFILFFFYPQQTGGGLPMDWWQNNYVPFDPNDPRFYSPEELRIMQQVQWEEAISSDYTRRGRPLSHYSPATNAEVKARLDAIPKPPQMPGGSPVQGFLR